MPAGLSARNQAWMVGVPPRGRKSAPTSRTPVSSGAASATSRIDEGGEALAHLTVARVEEPPEHGPDRRLLMLDVHPQLAVDVREEARTDILELRLVQASRTSCSR
jgi:hypothetical protein